MKNKIRIQSVIFCLLFLVSCAPVYSPYIFDQTAELKKQTLSIMDKATEPYSKYETKVDVLKSDLVSLFQQEKMRKRNGVKVKQWNLLLDPQGNLLNGSLEKWRKDTVMSETFIVLQRNLVEEAFNLIQEVEKQRLK